jgi:hypothetical protein
MFSLLELDESLLSGVPSLLDFDKPLLSEIPPFLWCFEILSKLEAGWGRTGAVEECTFLWCFEIVSTMEVGGRGVRAEG